MQKLITSGLGMITLCVYLSGCLCEGIPLRIDLRIVNQSGFHQNLYEGLDSTGQFIGAISQNDTLWFSSVIDHHENGEYPFASKANDCYAQPKECERVFFPSFVDGFAEIIIE